MRNTAPSQRWGLRRAVLAAWAVCGVLQASQTFAAAAQASAAGYVSGFLPAAAAVPGDTLSAGAGTAGAGTVAAGVPRAAAGMTAVGAYPAAGVAAGYGAPATAAAATAYPAPYRPAYPLLPRPLAGQCAASFAPQQQCGGMLYNALFNCSSFAASCPDNLWVGGCCPAGAGCAKLQNAGGACWTCGGSLPATLVAASNAAGKGQPMCSEMVGSDYDYGCALGASMLFYEAQRSGKLPATNRIRWRGDAGLLDRAPNGASLVGGWYDAGDMTRFTFPAAFTLANLALSFLEFPGAYEAGGQTEAILGNLRWGADWLLAARYESDAFVAVTWAPGADVNASHLYWGKPEEIRQPAEVRALRAPMQGADLLGQGAAALAAVSLVFKDRDATYSQELLETAQGLFQQAQNSRGLYSNSIPEVKGFYTSYSYIDDLAWAAAWLAMRTEDADDLSTAQTLYEQHLSDEAGGDQRRYDYNNMLQGVGFLLAKLDPAHKDRYSRHIRDTMALWMRGTGDVTYSPKGMAVFDPWGNLRYVSNQAFMGLLHNQLYPDQKRRVQGYTCFARKQARIMLGETGRSYVVGVGTNPPCRPHHRGASCGPAASPRVPCDCSAFYNPGCNPNTLYGALVGGPDKEDKFEDARADVRAGEVALDWNAGFTGMLAGLAKAPVSWDDCKAAGMADGKPNLGTGLSAGGGGGSNGAGEAPHGAAALWRLLAPAAAAALAALALLL